jgi:hypothetical protein
MSPRTALALAALLLGVAACGGDTAGGLDRSSYRAVYDATMKAVAAQDLHALHALLTERGWIKLQRDLEQGREILRDPERARRVLDVIKRERGSVPAAELERARTGNLEDVWRFLMAAEPRAAVPRKSRLEVVPGGREVHMYYRDPSGAERRVQLIQQGDGWYVEDLQL